MRFIKSFENENLAKKFSFFLKKRKIDNTIDVEVDDKTNKISYEIWVHDEDMIGKAEDYLEEFEKEPDKYPVEEKKIEKKKVSYKITFFFIFLSIFIYLINLFEEIKIKEEYPKITYVVLTPIQRALLYDVPYKLIKIDELVKKYGLDLTKDGKQLSFIQKQIEAPFFKGFYDILLKEKSFKVEGTLFENIRKGQIWRLFTPCILHRDFLHLLFNMLWLWVLGKQMEQRVKNIKYILLMVIIGILSNTLQYLMSGPYFLGYSGIIMGMVGFIWSRQKIAPWEGYPLQKVVFLFLGIYVILMFILSFFSFTFQALGINVLAPNIANTAHISGFIIGAILGRFNFFSLENR